ncbi:hypothetical protein JGS39_35300 [Streptomyces sp. P01-B04]|uniref:hypothetical protein n=1 Tax=Streptomyces poriferorum TaxID=2798799 RepID=UPI001C5D2EA4|nr:hypothetical protein [Streptomyces poriferorum]MBW5254173.1 hypothetical protein [Streptomyces poriferorum]MBW5262064.1 hypothetical protein [Streptomyces poriferorum]
MTTLNELRLLPWAGPEGKPCYLSTNDPDGYMSRLADNIEAIQLNTAAHLLEAASETFADQGADPIALRRLGHDLAGALRDVLRVAVSRGHLLAADETRRI